MAQSRNALNQARLAAIQTSQTFLNRCGGRVGAGTLSPVAWNETLFSAADRQARDMANNNFVNALGSDGVGIAARVADLDSSLTDATQLVAGGFSSPRALINEWLEDRDTCAPLLDPEATVFAMACRFDSNSDFGTYWSLVLATD